MDIWLSRVSLLVAILYDADVMCKGTTVHTSPSDTSITMRKSVKDRTEFCIILYKTPLSKVYTCNYLGEHSSHLYSTLLDLSTKNEAINRHAFPLIFTLK